MAGKIFWENQFNQMREGKEPALTIDQEQEREKPQIQLEDVNAPVKQDLSLQAADQGVGVTDVAKAAASGGVGWAESTAEILVSTTVPGMILSLSDYVPLIKDKITEARRGWQEALGQAKKSIRESMSEPAKKAIEAELINDNLEFTDDAAKLSTWIMKGTETISRMVPDLVSGGLVGKGLYNAAYETAYKAGIAKGLTEQGAKVSANKIASAAASVPTAFMATTSATGGAGVQAREAIESLPWSDLQKSEIFVNNFKSIDADPANESMSDQQKLSLARTLTAEHASSKIMQDPALLTVNALASFIGDATLGRMIAGKIGGGIVNKAVTGFAAEAPTEAAQSAAEQYAQNLILIDVAGQDVDPMKGVKRAAAEGGLLGGAVGGTVGGTVGAVDKVTGRESQPLEPQLDGPEIIPEEVATIADGDLQPGAAPEPLTVAERRAALNEKLAAQQEQLRRERVLAGTGEVQEALSKGQTAPTPIELIAQAKEQAKVQRDEFVEGRAAPTVAERRDNLKRRLEQQSAEYAKQQAEAGKGPVQERLSMPTSPTVDELLIKASTETGPSPYELEYRKQAERDYIEKVKDAAIPQGLKGKPNAVKLLNKGYRNAIADFGGLSEQLSKTTYPDPKTDTMAEVIGKMGGIGRATAESEGFDPAMFKGSKTFSANGKMTFDDAAEKLNELGYRNRQGDTLDSNDVVDMLYGEINNTENHYSTHVDPKMLTADAQIVRTWAKALGGADKLSATIKKSLAGERLGKRQAEVMEDMLDSIAAMRSEGAEQAKQTLDARRSEREAKRIESFNSLMAEATGNKSHIADIDSYNRMLSEKPEYYSEEQVILDELVATAGDIDFNATSEAIDLYESGKTSLPNLLTKLSDIAHKRERTYAEAKPAIQAVSKPTTQPIEGVVTERVTESEGSPAAEAAEPKPIKPEEKEPEKVIADKTDLAKQRDRRHAELEVKQAEGLVLETQQKIEQQKATGGRTDILNSNLQRQISGANRIRAKYGLGPMKVETKPAAVEVSSAEKAKVVNASSHKTVRDKVLAWADIKFGDTIIDHRGAFIGVAVADFDSKKPRAIKIRKSDGTTELYNFKSILGSDVEVMSIDAIGRIKGREELDSAATVMAESRPEKAPEVGTTLDETTEQQNRRILDAVKADIVKGFSPKSNNDLKIIGLKVFGLDKSAQVDNNKLKLLQEAFETVEAQKRREAINRMLTVVKPEDMALKTAYSEAVSSYESQPNLDVRTAKSSDMQAYSTPTPMALLANIAAGVDSSTTVYEPTAGNGLLLMTANPKNTIANELDPVRASSLAWSGFDVTVSDATSNNIGTKVDAVLANPPFGKMPDGSVVVFDDYQGRKVTLKEIDHVIARNALEAMSDNGKATLIIGANMKEPGVYKGNQKAFLNFVYSNYNVAHHVEVDGTLYKGQGAGFPTQMIVIHGRVRGGTGKFAPISGVVKRINSWSELYENFKDAGLLDTKGQRFDGRAKSDGVVSSNTGKTELRGGVPEHTVESRISDIEAKREADNGLSKPTKLARSKSADIGKPTDGTVTSQPDISGTGLVGSPSVLSGKSITDKPIGKTEPTRLSVDETTEAKKPSTKASPRQIDTKVDKANAFQARYKTASNGFNEGVLTPNNMASYTQSALADLQERHGSVDKFVIDKLGYDSPEEMHAAFMGLQADAIALAIDNIENGRAIVIGDQTGVGKGRQAAGIIRYAMKKGKVPIFISQKPNLFTDMYDDLADIGVQSFKPLIMNDDKGYVSKGGEKLFSHTPAKRKELLSQITSSGLPEGYNGLFLTYSQIASDSKGFKTGLLNMLAENSLIIMDESHSAAGDSKTGLVFQDLVNKAFGVTYLSATYAKRPDNMMLYMRTDLGLATEDRQSLLDSVNAGGLGMQTYIAGKLAEAGQMVRRERSFDGISINNKVIDDKSGSTAKSFDKATKVLRTIQDLSSYWAAYVESELADYIQMKHGLDTAVGGNKADKNINVTSFSSIVHNNIAQLSLSLKAREIGRMAIDSIKEGKRPVIALDNTLGSALQSYMSDNGLSVGDKARDMTYATVIRNALDGVLSYTVKVPGETKGVSVKMPVSQINSPIIKDLYDKAVSEIEDLATEGIPGSPIDAIRHEITKAGFTVSEITGRNVMIDYSNNNQIVTRPADEMDRRAVVDKFNSGSLDVLILNQAGSTGLSIHASEKFADTKPRHMIVAQPSLDINTYMQMLGRVNRTDQVALPSYDNVWLNLPSEKRPAAVLSRKMSSLNANTSGNTESATSVESVDMLNQYGDQVVKAFVDANGDYLSQFSPKLVDIPDVDSAVYFLGKLAVLPVSVQEEVISVVESEYVDLINYLDSTGQNDLNMTEIDLDAKPISQKKLAEGRKEAGVFSDPVYLTKVDAKATGKAPTWSQVKEALSLTSQADFDNAIAIASKDTEFESRLNEKLKELESRKSDLISKDKDIEAIRKAIDDQLVRISDYESAASEVRNLFGKGGIYSHGSYINVVMSEGETAIPGVIVGIDYKHEKGNPYSSSKWKMKIMVADRVGKIDIPLSLAKKGSVQGKRWDNDRTMESRFNLEADKPARESRYVMTGNLVEAQALSHVKGQIKPITLNDGRIIQAMVLPRSFDAVDDVSQKLSVSHAQASKWLAETDRELGLMGLSNKSGDVTIRRHWKNDGSYVFEMPKSVSKGKQYWGNHAVEKVIGKQAVKGAGSLEVILNEQEMKRIVKIMDEISPLGIRNQAQISDYNKRSGKKENDFDTKGIKFSSDSIVTGNPKGMPSKEVDIVAKSFIKEYKGAAGIKPVVFQTQKEAMDYAGIQDDESVLRHAFYNPRMNEVVLIANNINGAADARKILRHEILAHHGLMRVVGQEEWQSIVNLVSASREAKSLKDIWADIDSRYEGFDENTKAEEVIANISEIEPSKLGEWGNRIIAAITRALRKAGLIGDKITATEIKDMIRIIGERIKTVSAGRAEIKNDIRFSQGQLTAKDGFSIPDETRKDAFIRSIQDKYRRLKVTQKAVKEQGGMIDENKDVYLAEELFHGKVGEDLRVMEDQFIKPLVEYMGKENVSREELDLYLIARHAPERNAQIAKINPDIQDGGSGMTDAEAAKVMDNFIKEGTIAKMQKAASFVDGIINTTKQRLIDSGLESQDVVDSWDATYKHYVPLKGFAVNESDADGNRIKTTGKGFSVHGKETMRAMGRRTVSESPLAYVISDATQSAIRARKNEVAQTMLRLVDANPDPELWQVFSSENPDTTRKITKRKDPVTGKTIETVIETVMPMHAMKDKYLGAKMNGEQYYIKLHDPRLMEAMANLGVEQANILTKTVGRVTRVLSALITSYNPEFALSNFARDVQTAVYNVLAEAKIEGGKALGTKDLAKKMVKDLPNSMKALKRGFRDNDFTGEWGVFLKEYLDSGAKTGWFVQKDIDDIKNDITRSISTTGEGAVNKLIRSKDKLIKFIDDYNDVVENASRLSVYVNARRQGLTEKAAASLAKNLTVNFNRRGEMTNSINALYMFFNASVQGTANMLRAVMTPADKTKKIWDPEFYNLTQKIAMALPIATMLMAQANREWGGDDDDGKSFYDKVPNYVKETNFVLMIPGSEGDFIKIPMPYGYNFFASIGHAIDRGMNTESTAVESAFDAVAAFAGAFSPLGAVGSEEMTSQVVKTAAPAILKPFVEMALNENFTGAPIYKEQNPFGLKTPDAYNSQRKTWEWAKGLSEYLNDVTGGNQFKSGVVDIAPESWQHLIKFAGGGLGSLFGRAQDLAVKTARGENVESREIPFWRKYMGSISESVDISEMYKRFDEIKTVEKQATMLPGQERIKFIAENRPKVKLIAMAKGIQTELTKLNKQKAAIDASKLSDEQKQLRIEAIENRKRLMAAKFNKAYNESVK